MESSNKSRKFDGSTYEEGNKQQLTFAREFFGRFPVFGVCVDCGCGDGNVSALIYNNSEAKKLVAFDVSDTQLQLAEKKLSVKGQKFLCCGFEDFARQDEIKELFGKVDFVTR